MDTTLSDCYRHTGTASTATCVACAQLICAECGEEVAGHLMCRPCVAAAEARLNAPAEAAATAPADLSGAPDTDSTPTASSFDLPAAELPVVPSPARPSTGSQAGEYFRPGPARRIIRGMLWGVLYGQWWTAWMIFSALAWNRPSLDAQLLFNFISLAFDFGFFGSLAGLIMVLLMRIIESELGLGSERGCCSVCCRWQ